MDRILLVGLGNLGAHVLDGLLRSGDGVEIVVAGREPATMHTRVNLAVFSAMQVRSAVPAVRCVRLDLSDVDAAAETVAAARPDVVVNCATLHPYPLVGSLPRAVRERLAEVGLGPWLPMHLALADRLMRAVADSGLSTVVINCAYPDAVNPALAGVGRAPLAGSGNVANNEPAIRRAIADETGVPLVEVTVRMVMHHVVSHRIHRLGDAGGAPFHLWSRPGGIPPERLFRLLATRYRREHGDTGRMLAAASTVALVSALLGDDVRVLHVPGPQGLPGGYPAEVSRHRLTIVPPDGLPTATAVGLNTAAQRFDGIEKIEPDGTVCLTARAVEVFAAELGYRCERFTVDESTERAVELRARCAERAARG